MSQPKNESPSCEQEEILDQPPLNPGEQFKCETKNNEPSEEDICSGRQKTFPLSISLSYVKDWDTTDAFRELYQNW
ncbi:hypothetical protein PMG11_10414 [Penicillium brasilianum]|uniref:Uncharacterized protein n=1 Tax=Penicillium brasilianum TaxID=104259 RepID=A0A0F7TZ40_PENBI|nr:hypothetical protein PMG11_10414 [Penicillium brasilianum]